MDQVLLLFVLNPLQLTRAVKSLHIQTMARYMCMATMLFTNATMVTSGLEVTPVLVRMVTGWVKLLDV